MPSGRTNNFLWKWAWPTSRDPTIFGIQSTISLKLLELETSNLVYSFLSGMPSRHTNIFPWKWAWPTSRDPTIFGIQSNISPNVLELETSNLVGGFELGMPSRRTNNFPESGRGLGHVTPTIFGSTVGYPSNSLATCSFMIFKNTSENEACRGRSRCGLWSGIHSSPRWPSSGPGDADTLPFFDNSSSDLTGYWLRLTTTSTDRQIWTTTNGQHQLTTPGSPDTCRLCVDRNKVAQREANQRATPLNPTLITHHSS